MATVERPVRSCCSIASWAVASYNIGQLKVQKKKRRPQLECRRASRGNTVFFREGQRMSKRFRIFSKRTSAIRYWVRTRRIVPFKISKRSSKVS